MADPVRYSIGYSFSSFQANNPSTPLPAARLDDELASIATSTESLRSSVADIRRSDGNLVNELVTYDSLASEIRLLFDNGAVSNAVLLADAVASADADATAAAASAAAAAASAATASEAADPAPLFAGAVAPAVTLNSATTTDIGGAASTHVVINGVATINSFGSSANRLRIVRFNGSSTLTHNAVSLILLNKRTRIMRAGDQGIYLSDATGNWRELHFTRNTSVYYVEQFATVAADGVTDDRVALQAVIDLAQASGGGLVVLAPGRTYRIVINGGDYDGFILKDDVTLDLNNARIELECTGSVYGIRLRSYSHISGPGTVKTTVSTTPGSQSMWHAPVSVGAAYGEVTDVSALGDYINAVNWSVRNLTLETVRSGTGGAVFEGMGGISHGLLEDLTFPDNSVTSMAIGFDHGTVGALDASDIPASRTLFDAGTAYSVFPHDITIRRIKIGRFAKTKVGDDGGFGIRLSGCYKITIEDVEVAQSTYAGFFHTAGDFGFEFAPSLDNIPRRRGRGVVVKNYHVYNAAAGYGFFLDNFADNIAAAAALGYAVILPPIGNTDIVLENCRTWSESGSAAGSGFYVYNLIGGTLRNCFAMLHQYGVQVANGVDRLLVDGGEFITSYKDGIYIGDSDKPEDITIRGAKCYNNGQDSGATFYAGVRLAAAVRPLIEGCILGISSESTQEYGVRVDTSTVDATIEHCNVLDVATSGTAYSLADATSYGSVFLFRSNAAAAAIASVVGGVNIVPIEYVTTPFGGFRRFISSRASVFAATPAAGAWRAGDTVEFNDPVAGGYSGSKCVTAGSPGTWNNYGVLAV